MTNVFGNKTNNSLSNTYKKSNTVIRRTFLAIVNNKLFSTANDRQHVCAQSNFQFKFKIRINEKIKMAVFNVQIASIKYYITLK